MAKEGDITVTNEPTITTYRRKSIKFDEIDKTCKVTYLKGYMEGDVFIPIGREKKVVVFANTISHDESVTPSNVEYSELVNKINAGANIFSDLTVEVHNKIIKDKKKREHHANKKEKENKS